MLRTVIRPIRPDLTLRLGDGFSRKGNTQTETVFRVSVKNINSQYCNDRNCDKMSWHPPSSLPLCTSDAITTDKIDKTALSLTVIL